MLTCQKQLSDERLLAHIDGELPAVEDREVVEHLKCCQACSSRCQWFEARLSLALLASQRLDHASASRARTARLEFHRRIAPELSRFRIRPWRLWAIPVAALASALLCVFLINRPDQQGTSPNVRPGALELARRTEHSASSSGRVLRQEFLLGLAAYRSPLAPTTSTLEIVLDPFSGRSAARWSSPSGELHYAVWRPSRSRNFEYRPALPSTLSRHLRSLPLSSSPVSATSQTLLQRLTSSPPAPEQMSKALEGWIRQSSSEPLLLAREFEIYCQQNGIKPRVEYSTAGDHRIQLSAYRHLGARNIRVELVLDPQTYSPTSEHIVCESGGQGVELTITLRSSRSQAFSTIAAAKLFEPDARFVAAPKLSLTAPSRSRAAVIPLDTSLLLSQQVQVFAVLHQLHACLGDPVTVRMAGDRILVSGMLDDPLRKREIEAALARLSFQGNLLVDLHDAGDVSAMVSTLSREPVPVRPLILRSGPAALASALSALYPAGANPRDSAMKQTAFRNLALQLSQDLMADGWALVHLERAFSGQPGLTPQAHHLLAEMLRDHRAGILTRTSALNQLFAPLLTEKSLQGANVTDPVGSQTADIASDTELFAEVRRCDGLIRSLLGDSPPAEVPDLLNELDSSLALLSRAASPDADFRQARAK